MFLIEGIPQKQPSLLKRKSTVEIIQERRLEVLYPGVKHKRVSGKIVLIDPETEKTSELDYENFDYIEHNGKMFKKPKHLNTAGSVCSVVNCTSPVPDFKFRKSGERRKVSIIVPPSDDGSASINEESLSEGALSFRNDDQSKSL